MVGRQIETGISKLLPWLHPHSPPEQYLIGQHRLGSTARSRRYVDSPQSRVKESLVSVAPNLCQQLYLANDASQPVNYCDGDTSLFIGPYQAVLLLPRIAKPPHETGVRLEWRLRLLAPDLDGIGGCQHSRLYLGSLFPQDRALFCLIISPRSQRRLLLCNHG